MASLGFQIIWMAVGGLFIGCTSHFFRPKGKSKLIPSMIIATLGAILTGLLAFFLNFGSPIAYSAVGAITFLIVTNSFDRKEVKVPDI